MGIMVALELHMNTKLHRGTVWYRAQDGRVHWKVRLVDASGKVWVGDSSVTPKHEPGQPPTKRAINDAKAVGHQKVAEFVARALDTPMEKPMPTFAEWVEECHANGAFKKATTEQTYRGRAKEAMQIFGTKPLDEVTYRDIEAYLDTLRARGNCGHTVSQARVYISSYFSKARRKLGVANPCSAVDAESDYDPSKPKRWLLPEEIAKILAADDCLEKLMYATCLFMGLRKEEALGLRWCDIDLNTMWLSVENTVTKARGGNCESHDTKSAAGTRLLPIPVTVVELLKRHRAQNPETTHVFEVDGKVIPISTFDNKSVEWTASLGLDESMDPTQEGLGRPSFRSMRHTYATYLLISRPDMKHATYMFGHSLGAKAMVAFQSNKLSLLQGTYAQTVWPVLINIQRAVENLMLGNTPLPQAENGEAPVINGS